MAGPEIIITVKNDEALKRLKEQLDLQQKLNTEIENQTKVVDDLYQQQKKNAFIWDAEKKTWIDKTKTFYEERNKLEDLKKKREELNKVGIQTEVANERTGKSFGKLAGLVGKLTSVFAVVTGAVALMVKALGSTEAGLKKLGAVTATVKGAFQGFLRTIASGDWANLIKNIKNTAEAERELKEATVALSDLEASNKLKKSYLERSLAENKLRSEEAKTAEDRNRYIQLAIDDQKALTAITLEEANKRVLIQEDNFKQLLEGRDIDVNDAISRIRMLASEYNYWFGENAVAIDEIRKQKDELTKKGKDTGLTDSEKKLHKELRLTIEAYDTLVLLKTQLTKPGSFNQYIADLASANNVVSDGDMALKALQRSLHDVTAPDNKAMKEWEDWWKEWYKIEQDAIDEGIKLNKELKKEAEGALIDTAPILASLEIQKNIALQAVEKLKTEIIRNTGGITAEQQKYINIWVKNINDGFERAVAEEMNPDILGTYLKSTLEGIQQDVIPQKDEIKSIWEIFGIDPETDKGKEQIDAVKEAYGVIVDTMDDIYEKQVDDAERNRELLDTRISETQRALELEMDLYQEGYANNVDAKRKELEELKKQRQQALVDEEAALKRQQTFDRISQAMNIATSASNILHAFTKLGPVGLILASAAIATLFTIWASVKTKSVAVTKLAEGGSGENTGMITGKRHSQGGERFLDHVEVERGESWGVLSRPASSKYGEVFHDMVSSFNKDQMPSFMPVTNQVRVENSGPNQRLDKVNNSLNKLNENLTKQTHISQIGNKKVIKTGNKVRIIG